MSSQKPTESVNEDKWYESTLPIVLTVILSVILIILIIIRLVQLLQQKRAKRIEKKAKERGKALEENPEEGRGGAERSTAAEEGKKKRKKTTTWSKKAKKQETQVGEEDALIVPANENGSLLQSGVRAHPTRKVENKSWYDSKVIPFIDETDQSLDNLYLPEKVTYEAV
nr:expressed conserved protein [Hymenolepis microstoma]